LLAKIEYHHDNGMSSKLNHLFCLLKYYNKSIKKPDKFLKRFNFTKQQLESELVPNILKHKDMLYHMAKTKVSTQKEVSILYRLVYSLQIEALQNVLYIFKAKFKKIQTHKAFQYCSFKMKTKSKHKFFSKCQYKLEIISEHKDEPNTVIDFKYSDELTVKQSGKFCIYVRNKESFGFDQFILIQKILLEKEASLFTAQENDSDSDSDSSHSFINNLFLDYQTNSIKLRNPAVIASQLHHEILSAKYKVSINSYDNSKNHDDEHSKHKHKHKHKHKGDDGKEEQQDVAIEYELESTSVEEFELVIPKCVHDKQDEIYALSVMVKPNWKSCREKFKFTKIKTITLWQYKIEKNRLSISNHFRVEKWNAYDAHSGILQIFCKQSMIINANAILDANGCGYDHRLRDDDNMNATLLRFGHGVKHNAKSVGGGIIELVSLSSIINEGRIECNGICDGYGGSIRIKCKKFINRGIISAQNQGKITILCEHYKDDEKSMITPPPHRITPAQQAAAAVDSKSAISKLGKTSTPLPFSKMWKKHQKQQSSKPSSHSQQLKNCRKDDIFASIHVIQIGAKGDVMQIPLTYCNHHPKEDAPHDEKDVHHPKRLVAGHDNDNAEKEQHYYYQSSKADECWIVFAMDCEYLINRLCIKNVDNECAIQSVQLYLGNQTCRKWYALHKQPIRNIKNSKKALQAFHIESVIDCNQMYNERLHMIKIQIVQNYGGKHNAFHSLQIFGQRIY